MSVFGYLKRKLKKAIKRGVEPSEAKDIYEEEHTKQQKEMFEEARFKKRGTGRYEGRRVKEHKAVPRAERAEQRRLESILKPKDYVDFKYELENESLSSAKYFAKKKLRAVRVEEEYKSVHKNEEPIHIFHFYNKDNFVVAKYFPNYKHLIYADIKDVVKSTEEERLWDQQEEREKKGIESIVTGKKDMEFQEFTKKIIRKRFPDRPGLLSVKIRKCSQDVLEGVGGCTVLDSSLSKYGGVNILISDMFKTGSPDAKNVLTHELTHQRRFNEGEHKLGRHTVIREPKSRPDETMESDKEEIETELEALQRGTIVDYGTGLAGLQGSYWGIALGRNWRDFQLQDYKTLTKRESPRDSSSLIIPSTRKITQNISLHKRDTNFWYAGVRKGGLKQLFSQDDVKEDEGRLNMIIGKAENIDTNYITSEGDYLHAYSPFGKVKPLKMAKFLDRIDGVTGEEDVFQILDHGKRLLISDKATPDRIVSKSLKKKKTQQKKQKPFGFIPKFKPLDIPTFNLPLMEVKKVKPKTQQKTQQKKKGKKTKDPIKDVLSFKFF